MNSIVNINWKDIKKYSSEDVTYFLYLEGKTIDALSIIRNLDKATVRDHVVKGKIKYGILGKSSDIKDLFNKLKVLGKQDKIKTIDSLDENIKKLMIEFIKTNYANMYPKDKQAAVWILGELKDIRGLEVILKASVHKFSNIRRLAISAMRKLENKKCEIALIKALDDANPQIVSYAIKGLAELKSINARKKILKLKHTSNKKYVLDAIDKYMLEFEEEVK